MGFLAPLFALGALAIAGPILFHLIRRTTREKTPFSTIMFLEPSPPRITERSRLENIWLLLLRCLVIALLALAFARPFLQRVSPSQPPGPGRRIVMLADTSASMRRETLWPDARAKIEARLRAAEPMDEIALLTFDREVRTVMSFEAWKKMPPNERAAAALQRLAALTPGWSATRLDAALLQSIEILDQAAESLQGQREIVVVSDMQEGAQLDGLQGYQWPRGISVTIIPVTAQAQQNAAAQWLSESEENDKPGDEIPLRVRVINAAESRHEQFQLRWQGAPAGLPPIDAYVPAGQARIVRVANPPPGATALTLSGDDTPFDNTLYILPPHAAQLPVLFIGPDAADDTRGSLYFLRRAFPKTTHQNVEILVHRGENAVPAYQLQQAQLLVLGEAAADAPLASARQFARDGRIVVLPLTSPASASILSGLLEMPALSTPEATVKDYALLAQIDFRHPLFAAFADPRYSDFAKIHWWKYRRLDLSALPGARTLAQFDDGDPAIVQAPLGKGSVVVVTSSWRPSDSQLALSSKFVPLLQALLEQSSNLPPQKAQYFVGDEVPMPGGSQSLIVRKPDGAELTVAPGARFSATDRPGIYTISPGTQRFVVNLAPEESRLAPLSAERLISLGVPVRTAHETPAEIARREGQAQAIEIENQQKLWRWALVAALGVLLLETLFAGKTLPPRQQVHRRIHMITPLLQTALEPVIGRQRSLRRLRWLVLGLVLLTIAEAVVVTRGGPIPDKKLLAVVLIVGIYWVARMAGQRWHPDLRGIARRIEQQHPELHALLITAVEQKPDPQTGKFNFLQQRVIRQVAEESRKSNWLDAVPGWRLWSLRVLACVFAVATLVLSAGTTRLTAPALGANASAEFAVTVNPGDTSVERGSGLVVLADFHRHPPGEATLVVQSQNQPAQRIPLIKNLDDPVFGGGLPEVDADLTYRVEYAGQATRDFAVKVFEHPRLDRADATLRYPDYTKLPEKKVPDTHRVSAVEGTRLDVAFQLNKPVKSATLVAKDGAKVPLAVQADKPLAELRDFVLKASQTYELKLEDADGRANKLPAQFIVEALPNRRPELKFITPKGDPRVSPIEEVAFEAEIWDDFGLSHYGLTINIAGQGEKQIELGHDTHADEKRQAAYLLKLEDLGVKPDQLITWFLWADDLGPDGKVRRTETDMYFAEVRPFEEIFRRDKDGGGQGDGDGESEEAKLAEMQKQIVSATWNLKRAEDRAEKPSDKYLKDEPVVRNSQAEALQQANKLLTKLEDPKLHALAENAAHEMQIALDHLTQAAASTAPLSEALASEETAYDASLKLAAHEFRVRRNKSQGKGMAQPQKRQLDELEMKDEKERYETNREAKPEQNQRQREQLAILNRLKELAQRQQDINERLKELQTALQDAKTEQQKEEIRRQLKRLQEEEKQILADIDETKQKMEQSAQQAQLADERQQLEKTRGEAQQASEAMEKGAASEALASGTRAQRDLQEMRDEFRKKTSGQFSEDMRQMRSDARELAQNQEEIAGKLQPQPVKQERPKLEGNNEREQLAEKFTKQKDDLGKLTEKMREVSEQAEAAEPLLAKELYDTLRKTTQAGTDQTLEKTQELAQRGYTDDARKFEEKAHQEIQVLKSGVERAAESVLGNEAEALRSARAEVDSLKKDLEREIARARPDLAQQEDGKEGSEKKSGGEQKGGEQSGSGQQPGAPSPSHSAGDKSTAAQQSANGGNAGLPSPGEVNSGQREAGRLRELAGHAVAGTGGGDGGNGGGGADTAFDGPLTGERFVEWSDRLRNVEEMVDDPTLRAEIARIRETAKGVRVNFKRNGAEPKWDMVKTKIGAPLAELHDRLTEELARRESKESLVPLDRDPVPPKYVERVRRYYEELGR